MYLSSPVEWYDILYLYAVHTDLKIKRSIVTKTLINDIALSVLPSVSLVKLKNDIIERGLTHPIIVIENTKANYDMAIRQVSEDLILPFDRSIGGNGMIKKIIAEQLDIAVDKVKSEHNVMDDLGADSLDTVEIIMKIEEEYDITIPDEDVEEMKTVQDILDYVE